MTSYIVLGGAGGLLLVGLVTFVLWATGKIKKSKFSKAIVVAIIFCVASFTIAVMYAFLRIGNEPTALIAAVFGFATVELWNLAGITKKKEEIRGGGSYEHSRNESEI